ncbi:tetratricopeptide repeat protein [bacterium]|nr:tetratricopeptide repeat protein [candidate division CSSED10-310 bacterium]
MEHRLNSARRRAALVFSIAIIHSLVLGGTGYCLNNTLSGIITDEMTGEVLVGATVTLFTNPDASTEMPERIDKAITNEKGEYLMKNIDSGTYELRVEIPNYRFRVKDVIITNNEYVTYSENVALLSKDSKELTPKQSKARAKAGEAIAAIEQGDFATARKHLEKAAKLDPDYSFAHNCLGIEYQRMGDTVNAESQFKQARDLDPGDPAPLVNLGGLYNTMGKFTDALPVLGKAIEMDSHADHAYVLLGEAQYQLGNYDEAEKALMKGFNLAPDINSRVLLMVGNINIKKQSYAEARDLFQKYLDANPEAPNREKIQKNIDVITQGLEGAK